MDNDLLRIGVTSEYKWRTMSFMQEERVYFRLSTELKEKVEKEAKSFEMSTSDFIRWILIEAVKED